MKPYIHARISAGKYGGVPEDYQEIHEFFDHSKIAVPDMRHRALLHSSWGIYLVERVFGQTRTNSAGKVYSVRDVAEDHVIQDLGFIPTLERWLEGMVLQPWMTGTMRHVKTIPLVD